MFAKTYFVGSYFVGSYFAPPRLAIAPPPPPPPPPPPEEGWVRVEEPTGVWVRVG